MSNRFAETKNVKYLPQNDLHPLKRCCQAIKLQDNLNEIKFRFV